MPQSVKLIHLILGRIEILNRYALAILGARFRPVLASWAKFFPRLALILTVRARSRAYVLGPEPALERAREVEMKFWWLFLCGIFASGSCFADSEVCMGTQVPSGYVIVGYSRSSLCVSGFLSDSGPNQMTIALPYDDIVVCHGSPLPSGYHYSGEASSDDCTTTFLANPGTNAFHISI